MASCLRPITVYNRKAGHAYLVPCGKCECCLERKRNTWIHRIEQERLHGNYRYAHFISLSYSDEFLPYESYSRIEKGRRINVVEPTGEALLNPYDLSLFLKKFRKYSGEQVSYFACGEYGDPSKTHRPHFHLILFTNLNWEDTLKYTRCAWSKLRPETSKERYQRYKKSRKVGYLIKRDAYNMNNRISFGRDQVRAISAKRIRYVSKYVQKIFHNEVVPPFYRVSNGLGKGFLFSDTAKLLTKYNRHFTYFENGLPVALSRYYSSRLFSPAQMDLFNLKVVQMESLPENIDPNDFGAVKEWYDYQCVVQKQKLLHKKLKFYGISKYA